MLSLMLILLSGQVVAAGTLAGIVLQLRNNSQQATLLQVPTEE